MIPPAAADHTRLARRSTALAWLALCPLLAASTSPMTTLGLGVAACAVVGLAGVAATAFGRYLPPEVRQAALAVLAAGLATAVVQYLMVWQTDAQDALGRAVPLVAAGTSLTVGTDTSSWMSPDQGLRARMIAAGLAVVCALLAIGAVRALAGHGLQLAQRPAGGFVLLGLLLAAVCAVRNRAAVTHLDGL